MNSNLEKLIKDFNLQSLEDFFRSKASSFEVKNEPIETNASDFTDGIKFGEFTTNDSNKDELAVYSFKVNKPLSERSGKKAQYDLAKKILKQELRYTAGIFVFYDYKGDFRFSLVYDIPISATRRDWSNFRRFTYFVSKDQTNKTFLKQIGEGDFSTLESIKEAFSVEKVTWEFYSEIANWYFWALKHVKFPPDAENQPNGREISLIRFLTRIIFIWFMKEKGLIKDDLFDKSKIEKILINLDFKESTYYKAILQNLFFATLNTPINERKFRREREFQGRNSDYMNHNYFRYHKLFKNPDDMLSLFKDIPFLNGGLFECLDKRKDDPDNETGKEVRIDGFSDKEEKQPIFPNELFFSDDLTVDLTSAYQEEKYKNARTRGLINILSSYSFTIDENTPTDEEVALDPELLGKVFENLLASYNPETATTARKATGSYYTPREIVDYMAMESLKEYFKTKYKNEFGTNGFENFENNLEKLFSTSDHSNPFDEIRTNFLIKKINEIKILDPAVGSGAFPMGMLHKLVFLLSKLDPHNEKWRQEQLSAAKKITDPKLRQQIVQKIDESFRKNELDYGRKLYLIQNCIYGIDIQPIAIQIAKLRFFISLLVDEKNNKNRDENFGVEPLPNLETKLIASNTLVGVIRERQYQISSPEYEELEKELFALRQEYFTASDIKKKKQIEKKDREVRLRIKGIIDKSYSYRFYTDLSKKIAEWNPYNTNDSANWFDVEWMFGIKDGFDIVIGNPPYIQLQKAINNKQKYADLYKDQKYQTFDRMGDIYCLFYEKGIQLLKPNGILAYITSNKWMRAGYGEKLREFFTKRNPRILIDLGPNVFENATVDTNILLIQKSANQNQLKAVTITEKNKEDIDFSMVLRNNGVELKNLSKDAWFIGSDAEQRLKEKIERIGKPLKEWDVKIYYGIKTGLNEAFIIDSQKRQEILANCKDESERRRTEAIIKPILRGRDIKRYYYEWAGLWVIGTFPALHLDIEDFPALKKYFLDNFDIRQLEQSGKKYPKLGFDARKKTGNEWFETQDHIVYYPEFEKEKVVWTPVNSEYSFCILAKGIYFLNSVFMITGNYIKYFCGIFNSILIRYYLTFLFSSEEEYAYGSKQDMKKVPTPSITPANEPIVKQIEALVDKILEAKTQDKNKDTSAWERDIDGLVYKLYDLTEEEIKIIEGGK